MSDVDDAFRTWYTARHGNSIRVGSLAILLWDYALTFEEERQLFWVGSTFSMYTNLSELIGFRTSLTRGRQGYSICPLSNSPDVSPLIEKLARAQVGQPARCFVRCLVWFLIEGFLGMVVCWSVQIILQLRIFALYDRSPKVKTILVLSFCTQFVSIVVIFANAAHSGKVIRVSAGPLLKCQVMHVESNFWAFWVTLLSYECVLFALALIKGYEHLKLSNRKLTTWAGLQVGLSDILVRDSVIYYLGCCLIYVANLILWVESMPDSFDLATGLAVAYPSLIGNNLMLNLRRVFYDSQMSSVTSPSDISLPSLHQLNDVHANILDDTRDPTSHLPCYIPAERPKFVLCTS
ncbi:hypothetical protein V5O48_007171 [Marasmius crinis-equi]|uniref:DUF6533 domain-containing protein n=1 Tax=Marasmius crinis-equi TaxID=585013 RepID=A0ABR3FI08_9AGAR